MTGVFFDWSNGYIARYAEGTSHKSTGDEICSLDGVGWQKGGRAGAPPPATGERALMLFVDAAGRRVSLSGM